MAEHEKNDESSFKVVDKRRFTASGDVRTDAPPREEAPVRPPEPRPAAREEGRDGRGGDPRKGGGRGREAQAGGGRQSSGMDFLSFIASLATNALAALGALPEAQARGMPVNHNLAREYIDIIVMLQEKTRGNLSPQEDQAMQRLVTDLRMQFVEHTKRAM